LQTIKEISESGAKDLLQRDFKFAGSTINETSIQAVGMTNDRFITCLRDKVLS
jgi:3-methyladenine DNA glycosylase Tag